MDLSQVTDISVLKSLAYDMVKQREMITNNLQMVEQRIGQLSEASQTQTEDPEPVERKKKK